MAKAEEFVLHLLLITCVIWTHHCGWADAREYFIMCSEEEWDYAPGGSDLVHDTQFNQESSAHIFLEQNATRIGHKYKKAIYREYTDGSFTIEKPKPVWLGFVGPIIKAEVGDSIQVHFKNNASRNYTIHPHGVSYDKSSEGTVYSDDAENEGTSGDAVPPSATRIYTWDVTKTSGPQDGDPDCISWLYHSHVSPVNDIAAGLVGFLMTCRKGALETTRGMQMLFTYVSVVDENLSWYLDSNMAAYTNSSSDKHDEGFQKSNKMHAFNGYVYGHLPGFELCAGETIYWHMGSFGMALHSISVSGHSFEYYNQRTDSVPLTPARSATSMFTALKSGRWLVSCQVHDHLTAGMQALLNVINCPEYERPEQHVNKIRRYYLAAEEVLWNYAPSGRNRYDGGELTDAGSDSELYFKKDATHIGGVYKKVIYQEYTDFLFNTIKPKETHLGFLGPVIKAEVGDMIKVVFFNKASRPYSIHPRGVYTNKFNEGNLYNDSLDGRSSERSDDYVEPMNIHTYYWTVPEIMGPTASDPPCLTRMYTSGVDVMKDTYSGLVGPLLVCRRGALDTDDKQINVTKEFYLMFSVTDENKSWYLDENMEKNATDDGGEDFEESNFMHGINGRLYGNLDGLDMCDGDTVRWHIFSVGTKLDLHSVAFTGDSFLIGTHRKFVSSVFPGAMKTLDMVPSQPGSYGLVCKTHDHYKAGTKAIYNVKQCENQASQSLSENSGRMVKLYIQAQEVMWDYVRGDKLRVTDREFTDQDSQGGMELNATRIGGTYLKAVYREYTDESFKVPVERHQHEAYLGILGPIIRVEVGDVLEIVFRNDASDNVFSVKAAGLEYTGEPGGDNNITLQPSVQPKSVFTYIWNVSARSGPGPTDPECISSSYFSDVDPVRDVNSGLIGPLVICRSGVLDYRRGAPVRKSTTVNKDFALYFSVIDENKSWYLQKNILKYMNSSTDLNLRDEDFVESNRMHAANGFLYGKQPVVEMREGDIIDWYLFTEGAQVDMHSVHFHGNDLVLSAAKQHADDVIQLFPSVSVTARMRAVNAGKWLFHCHVNNHRHAEMQGFYKVKKKFAMFRGISRR